MKLELIGAATAIAVGVATPVLAAQSDDPTAPPGSSNTGKPTGKPTDKAGKPSAKPSKPDKPAKPSAKPSDSKASDSEPSDQGRESSARGRAHRYAMHAWHDCVKEKGKASCTKPAPPGHAYGRAHAPGQLKDKSKAPKNGDD